MKYSIVKARARRNKFDELAGSYYRDNGSQIVKSLKERNKHAYFGIQDEGGMYTIIGEKCVYFSDDSGREGEILNADFLKILQENAMKVGKGGEFEFVSIGEEKAVWVLNGKIMCAMWNILMLLCDADRK